MRIDETTSPKELKRHYAASGLSDAELEPQLSRSDLLKLASKHAGRNYTAAFYALLIGHEAADNRLLRRVLELDGFSVGTSNAAATSGKASQRLLRELARSEYSSVRDHARLALVRRQLDAGRADFQRLLDEHQGEFGIAIGVRMMLASHESTPLKIRRVLAQDEADLVAHAAERAILDARRPRRKRTAK